MITCALLNGDLKSQWVLKADLDNYRIQDIISQNNIIFAGTESNGIFRSSDNGNTWSGSDSGIGSATISSFTATSAGIFVSCGLGIYFSTNNGDSWHAANSGLSGGMYKKVVSRNENLYAAHLLAGVFKSTNSGSNWNRYALGEGDKLFTIYAAQNEFYISIANTIFRTTNDGETFESAIDGLTNLWVLTLSSFEDDLYAGTRDGIFHSTNTGNFWTRVTNGLTDTVFNVIINKNVNVFAGSLRKGIFLSTNTGQLWNTINSGLTDTNITSLAYSPQYLFAGSANGNLWRRPLSEIPTSIIEKKSAVPDYEIIRNFPNPFNPSTTISFTVNKNYFGNAVLKIYNSNGAMIDVRQINISGSGKYKHHWTKEGLSSGIYFYTIEFGNTSLGSKMVLLK